jgi:hypothetical protein
VRGFAVAGEPRFAHGAMQFLLIVSQMFPFDNGEHHSPHVGGPELLKKPVSKEQKVPVITDDDWEPTSPTGTTPVASGSGWGGLAPPLPPMGAVGGAATGVVRARVAALNAATGAVASRTFPLLARTTVVDAETQTDPMVFPFVFPGGGWTL